MRCLSGLFVVLLLAMPVSAQPIPDTAAYRIYSGEGQAAALSDVVAAMDTVEVVFLGEVHNDPTAHALQDTLLRRAYQQHGARLDSDGNRPVALSLEMFERDVQPVVDEYLRGWITEQHFLEAARPWSTYRSDYRPLVEFAKAHRLPVLAANAPRRYVNLVSRAGADTLQSLPAQARRWLPPLPYAEASPAYRAKWFETMQAAMAPSSADSADADSAANPHAAPSDTSTHGGGPAAPHGHGAMMRNMLRAQSLWDAAMAHRLAQHLMRQPEALVLHVAGQFHVSEGTGTPEHLARYRPGTRSLVIVTEPAADPTTFQPSTHRGLGDFVILTPADRVPSPGTPMPGSRP